MHHNYTLSVYPNLYTFILFSLFGVALFTKMLALVVIRIPPLKTKDKIDVMILNVPVKVKSLVNVIVVDPEVVVMYKSSHSLLFVIFIAFGNNYPEAILSDSHP